MRQVSNKIYLFRRFFVLGKKNTTDLGTIEFKDHISIVVTIRLDIPEMFQAEAEKYPKVKIIYMGIIYIGYDDSITNIIHKRIEKSSQLEDEREETAS